MEKYKKLTIEELKELELSESEKAELDKARKMKITFDEDCVETTPERAKKFKRINPRRSGGALA